MEKAPEKLELITRYFQDLSARQLQQLEALEGLYKDWNSKINVISRKDEEGLYEKHVLHSLSIAAVFDWKPGMHVLDLGTGGGFPGIPLAVFFPEVHFLLADSIGKKIRVAQAVAGELGLANVVTRHTRAEEIRDLRFHTVVSRAVASLGDLWNWSRPLLAPRADSRAAAPGDTPVPQGLVCLKGGDLSAEIAASGCRPRMMEIHELFPLPFFREKFVVYVPTP